MFVKFKRSTAVGGQHFDVGEVADLAPDAARMVCAIGKADSVTEPVRVEGPLDTDAAQGLVPEGRKFQKPRR